MEEEKGLAVLEERSIVEVKAQVDKIQSLMKDVMKEGEHYGPSFPGDKKKNLLKPGADKLTFVFRLAPEFEVEREDLPNGHREYRIKTILRNMASGKLVGQGLGSCSTMESKYRWRHAAKKCPNCGMEAIIKGKEEYGGGWVCFKKKGGCGSTFNDDDSTIVNQETGKLENPDIADVYNTILKIAKKRSYVDATITATAASDIFTQDAEDALPDEGSLKPAADQDTKPAASAPKKASAPPRTQTSAPPANFAGFVDLVNTVVPNNERPGWMQKAKGGHDLALLSTLAAEIRAKYPAHAAPTASQTEKLRIEVMEYINTIVPEPDRQSLRAELQDVPEDADSLSQVMSQLKARYGI